MKPAMIRALVAAALCTAVVAADEKPPSAEVVLRELKAGNDHHVTKRYQHPHQSAARQRHSDQVTRNATIGSTVIARRAGT